jgi:hypothetical protein
MCKAAVLEFLSLEFVGLPALGFGPMYRDGIFEK